MIDLGLRPAILPPSAVGLREEVRAFIAAERARGSFQPTCDAFMRGISPSFSRALGQRKWLGMTWPEQYGGGGRSNLERFVVAEELLASGAPVAAHWIAERQTGPLLLKFGNEFQRSLILPRIALGECYVAIGMSEPDTGSDLASVRTRADRDGDVWRLRGTKVWSSHAHYCHYMVALVRTATLDERQRHAGLSQFLVDLSLPGITIRPILGVQGEHHFNEVLFDDVLIDNRMVIGTVGDGWRQVTAELGYERSGPERLLSTFPLFVELVRHASGIEAASLNETIGDLWAQLWTLRQLSIGVAAAIDDGDAPDVAAALVKDLGTAFENRVIDATRAVLDLEDIAPESRLAAEYAAAVLAAPGFTIRGGTTEILRSVVARGLGVR